MCYENPKNKITAVPANEEEIWGATFKVTKCNLGFPSCDVTVHKFSKSFKVNLRTHLNEISLNQMVVVL